MTNDRMTKEFLEITSGPDDDGDYLINLTLIPASGIHPVYFSANNVFQQQVPSGVLTDVGNYWIGFDTGEIHANIDTSLTPLDQLGFASYGIQNTSKQSALTRLFAGNCPTVITSFMLLKIFKLLVV